MKNRNDIILEVVLNKVKTDYKDDVSLVCCYGSYVNGTANKMSDIDFYYVPKTDRAYELTKSFILDGIGFDFWPLNWERLEAMATFDNTMVSLVADCNIVYSNCSKDEKRFLDLQKKIQEIKEQEINQDMLIKAEEHIKEAMREYCQLQLSKDICEIRTHSGMLLMEIADAVTLMNNRYFAYGLKKHLSEVLALQYVPVGFEELYNLIINSDISEEIKNSCLTIINNTIELCKKLSDSIRTKKKPQDVLSGLYEEIVSTWNKIYTACDNRNGNLAFLAGTCLQQELDSVSDMCEFPRIDLMGKFNANDLESFKEAAEKAEDIMLEQLKKSGLNILKYDSIEDFKQHF